MPAERNIRILLADDHQMVRAGLRSILEKQEDLSVVAETGDGREAVRLARELSPHVLVMDITMPELNGIEATRQVLADDPSARVIALSMHSDRQIVTEALRAGAKGYLLKNSAASELLAAIRAVMTGRVYLSPSVAHIVVTDLVSPAGRPVPSNPSAFSSLTPREREVLQLLAEGKTNKEIAASLNIGVKTVETHRAQVMEKLNLRTVAQLTKYAIRNGMTSIDS